MQWQSSGGMRMLQPPQPRVSGHAQQLTPPYGYLPQIPANSAGAVCRLPYPPVQQQVMYYYPQYVGQNGQFVQQYPQAYFGQQMCNQQSFPVFQNREAADNQRSPIIQEVIEDENDNQNPESELIPPPRPEPQISITIEADPEVELRLEDEAKQKKRPSANEASDKNAKKLQESRNEASYEEKMVKSKDDGNKNEAMEGYPAEEPHQTTSEEVLHQTTQSVVQLQSVAVQQSGEKIRDTHERNEEPALPKEPCKRKNESFQLNLSQEGKPKKVKGASVKDMGTHEAIPQPVPFSGCTHTHEYMVSGRKSDEGAKPEMFCDEMQDLTSSMKETDIGGKEESEDLISVSNLQNQKLPSESVPEEKAETVFGTKPDKDKTKEGAAGIDIFTYRTEINVNTCKTPDLKCTETSDNSLKTDNTNETKKYAFCKENENPEELVKSSETRLQGSTATEINSSEHPETTGEFDKMHENSDRDEDGCAEVNHPLQVNTTTRRTADDNISEHKGNNEINTCGRKHELSGTSDGENSTTVPAQVTIKHFQANLKN